MYAVVKAGGKQYGVAAGDELQVERVEMEPGDEVEFSDVLMVADGDDVRVGAPTVEGAVVRATVVSQERGPKIRIFKFKAKKRYRRRAGHRQHLTRLRIEEITV